MFVRKYKFSSLFLSITFIVSIFILFFIVSVSYKQIKSLNDSSTWVVHSQKIHVELQQLILSVKDAEGGQRGYLLTRDTAFLYPYNTALEKIKKSFITLEQLTADNKLQQRNIRTLKRLIDLRFEILESLIKDDDVKVYASKPLVTTLLRGKDVMNEINVQSAKIIDDEMLLLKSREVKRAHEIYLSPLSFLFIALFSLIIFVIAFYRINRDMKNLSKINNQLLITQETFNHAEEIAEISHWYWNIETNQLTYSNNQYRLLGYEPYEFEPTVEKYLEFVHPDDRHIIIEGNEKVLTQSTPSIAYFRVIRKDGSVRNFKSIGKLISDHYGKNILIGITADITRQYFKDKMLEEKLFDLERSNNELSAFNQAASHDLQEPLRKIQTLISRIKEKDFEILSDKAKEYFQRTEVAANRMQRLIDDLLLFSRTNKADKVFELSDLNELLENSKQELGLLIEEKGAIINASVLPTLTVIPFQIQQLFINLIGNSIKYAKADVAPVITIVAKIVVDNEMANFTMINNRTFYKISIADNGIGFEQQYAENIFTLFSRLHDNSTYSGTGIGLTICKKIIENHKGFITAESSLEQGATFNIFLPLN